MRRLLLIALLAGCSQAAPASPGLTADVVQYRRDLALGVLQVRVVPERDLRVEAVRLVSPRFPGAPQVPKDSRLVAGRRTALPVPHGPPDCSAPSGGPARVVLALGEGPAGRTLEQAVDPAPLDRVADRLCAAVALAEQVRVAVRGVEVQRDRATAELVLERARSDEELAVTGFGGHVLLAVEAAAPLPVLAPDQERARVPLRLRTSRCDVHALAESKQTGTLRVLVRVGDRPPEQVLVRLGPGDTGALEDWVAAACGRG